MPEGPEVTWMTDQLQKYVGGTLKQVHAVSGRYKRSKRSFSGWVGKIKAIDNWGKTVWIELLGRGGDEKWIRLIPAMTGFLSPVPDKWVRLEFVTTKGTFYLNDQRNFATLKLVKERTDVGMFPLFRCDRAQAVKALQEAPAKPIADLLLDQRYVAGVGNYLRSEILGKAKVPPWSIVRDKRTLSRLVDQACKIMQASYRYQVRHGLRSYPKKYYGMAPAYWKAGDGRRVWYSPSQVGRP